MIKYRHYEGNEYGSFSYLNGKDEYVEIKSEKELWDLFPKEEFEFLLAVYEQKVAFDVDDVNELPDVSKKKPLGFRWVSVPHMCFTPAYEEYMLWHKDFGYLTAQ